MHQVAVAKYLHGGCNLGTLTYRYTQPYFNIQKWQHYKGPNESFECN